MYLIIIPILLLLLLLLLVYYGYYIAVNKRSVFNFDFTRRRDFSREEKRFIYGLIPFYLWIRAIGKAVFKVKPCSDCKCSKCFRLTPNRCLDCTGLSLDCKSSDSKKIKRIKKKYHTKKCITYKPKES